MARRRALRWRCAALTALAAVTALTTLPRAAASPTQSAESTGEPKLYLVTLHGPGAGRFDGSWNVDRLTIATEQNALLNAHHLPDPLYRWDSALNGFAVELTPNQVDDLRSAPAVASVEANQVRPWEGTPDAASVRPRSAGTNAGQGVVIGMIDTGLDPSGPLFTSFESGTKPASFAGKCDASNGWTDSHCNGKVVGARWYVDGFGAEAVNTSSALSPVDTDGHGTAMASIAAGSAQVPVRLAGERFGRFSGTAPAAHLAVYKACWNAPDPADDGCATADVVTAIDDATSDGVNVLTVPIGGPSSVFDTVEMALLGAVEADTVVVAAAGDGGTAAHPSPWVTTVGATTGNRLLGQAILPDGRRLTGAMASQRDTGRLRVIVGARAAAPGARAADARVCAFGSLDARRVAGKIVICERGGVGRVDKSAAVKLADGAAMVLVNLKPGSRDADVQSVPTVHLGRGDSAELLTWAHRNPQGRLRLHSLGAVPRPRSVAWWSPEGTTTVGLVKPDVVAPGTGVLGAAPGGKGWNFFTGSSAATAVAAGEAATLLGRRGWTPGAVRSALVTNARPLREAPVLASGGGVVDPTRAEPLRVALVTPARQYRQWLTGNRRWLNSPSIVLDSGTDETRRSLTNFGKRPVTLSASLEGFRSGVQVWPSTLVIQPGERVGFHLHHSRPNQLDDGTVVWTNANGAQVRIPVVIGR